MKKIIALFVVLAFGFNICVNALAALENEGSNTNQNVWNLVSYKEYTDSFPSTDIPKDTIVIDAKNYVDADKDAKLMSNYLGRNNVVYTTDTGFITYELNIASPGFYNLEFEYATIEGKQSKIERSIYIDGEIPFTEASSVFFNRIWKDKTDIVEEVGKNDISPAQEEAFSWTKEYVYDSVGYFTEPFGFYFSKGKHTLKIQSLREPLVLNKINLSPIKKNIAYQDLKMQYQDKGYKQATQPLRIQAEKSYQKSDFTIYPLYDRGSPNMVPYSSKVIKLNMIGSDKWQSTGQWISWKVNPQETGLYRIVTRYKQDSLSGMFVSRKLTINGEIPFEEAKRIEFNYNEDWQIQALGNSKEDYLFYFEEGKEYIIKLEVTIGDMAEAIRLVDEAVFQLNDIYRQILMITGAIPDQFRDYKFERLLPDAIKTMQENAQTLKQVSAGITKRVGKKGSNVVILDKLVFQLNTMYNAPKKIAKELENFKVNIGALATWVLESKKQNLSLDWIELSPVNSELPKAEKGFFGKLWHVLSSFLYSFTTDYYVVGSEGSDNEYKSIKVWVGTGVIGGRDQAQILRRMIDDDFSPNHKINVDLQLVVGGTLLPATLAGNGPDIALQVGNAEPVNYAMRKAVKDLSSLPGFDEVIKRFPDSAMVPYEYNKKVYALPESFSYPMMFCRIDVLDQIGQKIPQTWNDFRNIIPELKKRNMDIGLGHDFSSYVMMLYQNNMEIYNNNGAEVNFEKVKAITVFDEWVELFRDYKLPLTYDFVNRFRTGEMPIGIADFGTFNQLSVFAPEIRGRWAFYPIPGTVDKNGKIDRSVPAGGSASIMMHTCKDIQTAWKFMDWWTTAKAQLRFSRELEGLLGPSARYPTANIEAFGQIAWNHADYNSLLAQREFVRGIPEVPGGYITPRYFNFAFLAVVNDGKEASEELSNKSELINEELQSKREEFGLK